MGTLITRGLGGSLETADYVTSSEFSGDATVRLRHGSSAEVLKFIYPSEWDPADLTGIGLAVKDRQADDLSSGAVTIYPATTLDADAARYAETITLDSGASDLEPGDLIKIVGASGFEVRIVKGYNSTSKVVTLEKVLDNPYSDGDAVYGLFGSITLDLSSNDNYPVGKALTLVWTPAGTGSPITETAVISTYDQIDVASFELDFQGLYPRAYDGLKSPADRLAVVLRRAKERLRRDLMGVSPQFDVAKVRSSQVIAPALMALCAYLWSLGGKEDLDSERKYYLREYEGEKVALTQMNIWVDPDEDLSCESDEVRSHPHIFLPGW